MGERQRIICQGRMVGKPGICVEAFAKKDSEGVYAEIAIYPESQMGNFPQYVELRPDKLEEFALEHPTMFKTLLWSGIPGALAENDLTQAEVKLFISSFTEALTSAAAARGKDFFGRVEVYEIPGAKATKEKRRFFRRWLKFINFWPSKVSKH